MTRAAHVRDVAIDPETRKILRGTLVIEATGDIEIRLPHRLESPNKTLWAHWREKHRDKLAWHARLLLVMGDAAGVRSVAGYPRPIEALGIAPVSEKRRVIVQRQVPSSRNFIRDDDNLLFSAKGLVDCLRQLGFLRDDASKWTELRVTQCVSEDRRDWTVIRIEIPSGVSIPLAAATAARR